MKSQPFEANVRFQEHAAVIDLIGELNAFAEPALTAAYAQADADNNGGIILNFKDVTYINSTGIAPLSACWRWRVRATANWQSTDFSNAMQETLRSPACLIS